MSFLLYLGTIHFAMIMTEFLTVLPGVDAQAMMTGCLLLLFRLHNMANVAGGKKGSFPHSGSPKDHVMSHDCLFE